MHLRGGQVKKEDRWEVSCGHWGIRLENRLTGVRGASGHAVRAGCQVALVHLFLLQGGADPPPSLISRERGCLLVSSDSVV